MPKKIRRAELFFIAAEPSGPGLKVRWRQLPLRKDGQRPWPNPGFLSRVGSTPERLVAEIEQAQSEGALRHLSEIAELPDEFNLVLFESGDWQSPAALIGDDLLQEYRDAVEQRAPLLFEGEALFGSFYWQLSASDRLRDDEHLRLEFLEAVDAERRRYERLRRQYDKPGDRAGTSRRERVPEDVRIFVWRRDEGRCASCGAQQDLEFDHVVPLALGGSNTARNIQLLCERCNRSKGANIR
jgi:5-methylcytosine-specific restriction endonuclease McrA